MLNTTGSSGGLAVTGTGAAASGGTIQNTTGVGISLTSTFEPSFTSLNITRDRQPRSRGNSVTGLTYQDATIFSAGNGNDEQGMTCSTCFGTNLVEDVVLDDITEDGIQVRQNSSTAGTLTIRRLNVQDHVAGFGESGIEAQVDLASNLTLLVDDSDFAINTNAVIGVGRARRRPSPATSR